MDYKSCFILMPFNKADELGKNDLDYIYTHILKKAVEDFEVAGKKYFQLVQRYESKVGSIISGIVKNLSNAELVIADLTGLNPNVMYELGVRHSLKRGTIIISQNLDKLPSDLRDYLTVGYMYSQKTTEQVLHYDTFKTELHKSIKEIISTDKYDSPVLAYLQQRVRFRQEDEIEKLTETAIIYNTIEENSAQLYTLIEHLLQGDYKKEEELSYFQVVNLLLNNLSISLSEIKVSYDENDLYKKLTSARTMINEINKIFSADEYFSRLNIVDASVVNPFGELSIKNCLKKRLVNIFTLTSEDPDKEEYFVKYTTVEVFFKEDGILEEELLYGLYEYIEDKAKELDVETQIAHILDNED